MRVRRALVALVTAALTLSGLTAAQADTSMPVTGQGHVQDIGWMAPTSGTIGTTGKSLRLEAVRIGGPVTVQAHVQDIGWMQPVSMLGDGTPTAGTTGRALRLEAVRITLLPTWADAGSHVEYRCHVQDIGWMAWVRDGATCGTTGRSLRLEAMEVRLVTPATPAPTPAPTSSPVPTVTAAPGGTSFAVTADTGIDDPAAHQVMEAIGRSGVEWVTILGDLAYAPNRGADYCAMVRSRVAQPVALLPGNHEAQNGDGPYGDYVRCLPAPAGVVGDYATGHYYLDRGGVRYIAMSPNISLPSGNRSYARGTPEREQVKGWIDAAKASGMWVVVGMHIPCLTNGVHQCERSSDIDEMLMGKGVDVVLAGHDHTYARSHQLTGTATAPVVVDRDSNHRAGAGTVFVVVGNGGHNPRAATVTGGIWAVSRGGTPAGYLRIEASASRLTLTEVGVTGPLSDTATITRG